MPDYKQGKIYCLRSHQTDDIYIGSTIQPLHKRLYGHKKDYKRWNDEKQHYMTSFEIIKYDDCYIELLEECPCENKNQLLRREGELIRQMGCVNKIVAGRTYKEWFEDNKEKITKQTKKWREENKEQIAEKGKKYKEENKKKIAKQTKEYREKNKEQIAKQTKEYREENKEKIAEYQKKYYEKNREKTAEYNKKYYEKNREKNAVIKKKYNEAHKNDFKCELCNFTGIKGDYNRHLKTKKHITSKGFDDSSN